MPQNSLFENIYFWGVKMRLTFIAACESAYLLRAKRWGEKEDAKSMIIH